jgi:hypothetical protein
VSISGGKTQSTEKRDSDDSDDGKIKIILASCASHETVGKKFIFYPSENLLNFEIFHRWAG